ncbi:MAG: hypothetical protein IJU91_01370 [Selenomonadaceae bacterium]|nr:hypothetical protein [Selenomonadaceae bacterium]
MKKTYIQPNMVVKNVATQSIMAGSLTESGATFFDNDAETDGMVKEDRGGVWDDEW